MSTCGTRKAVANGFIRSALRRPVFVSLSVIPVCNVAGRHLSFSRPRLPQYADEHAPTVRFHSPQGAMMCSPLPSALGLARWRRGLVRGHLLAAIALVLVVLFVRTRRTFVGIPHIGAVVLWSDFLTHVVLLRG